MKTTRRLLILVLFTLVACSNHSGGSPAGQDPDAGQPSPPIPGEPREVSLDADGIRIDGEYRLLRGGSVQWFRIPEDAWEDRLSRFHDAGFNTVDIYIPWNLVEAEEGQFDFETPDLRRFLDLCAQYDLFVAIRPGPYITNEMDGGGLPAWLTRRATKRDFEADGLANLRTHDPDFIEAVDRYFHALNEVIHPYLLSQGGPVLLYVIENEYNWFEQFFDIDKQFRLDGTSERPSEQQFQPRPYIKALRDLVLDAGIDIPIVTCPGDAQASATGDVEGVIPFPNFYEWATPKQPEQAARDLLIDMHDPTKHDGAYLDHPSGSMEVERSAQQFRRLFMGGLDALYGFNMVGMIQPGYLNAITLASRAMDEPPHWGPPGQEHAPWLPTIFDFSLESLVSGFLSPQVGYFHNVLDYRGVLGPSGMPRESYFQFRRDNLFYDSVEALLGRAGTPNTHGLLVSNNELGTRESADARVHYWLDAGDGVRFVSIVNQSGREQVVPTQGVSLQGRSWPRFAPMSVPVANEPNGTYAKILPVELPVHESVRLAYTTSELLTLRDFNDDLLLVVYGDDSDTGEISISGLAGESELHFVGDRFVVEENTGGKLTVTVGHADELSQLVVALPSGKRLRIVSTNRATSGRWWFERVGEQDLAFVGLDRVRTRNIGEIEYEYSSRTSQVSVLAPQAFTIQEGRLVEPYNPATMTTVYDLSSPLLLPPVPDLLSSGRSRSDQDESTDVFDDSSWLSWTGEPRSLEDSGVYRGHAWYRAELNLEETLGFLNRGRLFIEHASDFVGIYVNGHYLATLAPLGTEIDSHSLNGHYQFEALKDYLHAGRNVIAFRTEIWGHGSFMFPKGKLVATQLQLPSVGYEGQKGLFGEATLAGLPLNTWKMRPGLTGQRAGYEYPDWDDSSWETDSVPMTLNKGEIRWYRASFRLSELQTPSDLLAPLVLDLKGQGTKATIYLNGQLIGRWLSDEEWLRRGSYARPRRDMWIANDPDHYPVPKELLHADDRENHIAIIFEDASHSSESAGTIDSLSLRYNQEAQDWQGDRYSVGPAARGIGLIQVAE